MEQKDFVRRLRLRGWFWNGVLTGIGVSGFMIGLEIMRISYLAAAGFHLLWGMSLVWVFIKGRDTWMTYRFWSHCTRNLQDALDAIDQITDEIKSASDEFDQVVEETRHD